MRLIKARVKGYRSIIDSGYFDLETLKTILVGPNEAGKTAILQALQQINPPSGKSSFDPLRDYPRAKYDEDIKNKKIDISKFTVVEGYFVLDESEKAKVSEEYRELIYVFGRYLDNTAWHRLDNVPKRLTYQDIEKDIKRMAQYFDKSFLKASPTGGEANMPSKSLDKIISSLQLADDIPAEIAERLSKWLEGNFQYLEEDNKKEEARYDSLRANLDKPSAREKLLKNCSEILPKFILFSNYFRIKPVLHLRNLAERVEKNLLDDQKYDYGNLCLLKFLGFTPRELANAGDVSAYNNPSDQTQFDKMKEQLDRRDYALNAATIRLTDAIIDVWNPKQDKRDANKLRIKADSQYLKVVVEDELGVEVELDQRSEGFQWMVSFFVVFFAEATDKHKNAILLLDEPGLSLHALKQSEFRETLSKLSLKNQLIFTTHSPFMIGYNELELVRVVEMTDRKVGTKVNTSLIASDSGAILPLQEALGYDLAQSLFFHKKNLVLEGLTDYWYVEAISGMLEESGKEHLEKSIALLPANCATKVVYYATILHAQNLKVAALLDSDREGDLAAKQDTLVNALGNKKILRTKDVYTGTVTNVEIEDLFRVTLVEIARTQLSWDIAQIAGSQSARPIIDIFEKVIGQDFSKFKLAKAFLRWAREHSLGDLQADESLASERLVKKINAVLR